FTVSGTAGLLNTRPRVLRVLPGAQNFNPAGGAPIGFRVGPAGEGAPQQGGGYSTAPRGTVAVHPGSAATAGQTPPLRGLLLPRRYQPPILFNTHASRSATGPGPTHIQRRGYDVRLHLRDHCNRAVLLRARSALPLRAGHHHSGCRCHEHGTYGAVRDGGAFA